MFTLILVGFGSMLLVGVLVDLAHVSELNDRYKR